MGDMIKITVSRIKSFGLFAVLTVGFITSLSLPVFALNNKYDEIFYSNNNIVFYNPEDVSVCGAEAEEEATLIGADNIEKIWNYLIAQKLSPEQAAGVLGNIQEETDSTFAPTFNEAGKSFDDDTSGYGIAGWSDDRRTNLIDLLTAVLPDLVTKYYTVEYSNSESYPNADQGYISKNSETIEFMPLEDNDTLLSAQLKFMVDEAKSLKLNQLSELAVDKEYGTDEDYLWDILKEQSSVADAANVWTYSFQGNDQAVDERVDYAQELFDEYAPDPTEDEEEEAAVCRKSSGKAVHPIADGTRVNEGYGGSRGHNLGGVRCGPQGETWHNGYDLNGANNQTVVVSSMSGTVTRIDYARPALNTVSIQNDDGFIIRYMHMNTGYIDVEVGQTVTAGQPIGKVGSGNGAYGAHLHIEIDVAGNTNTAVAGLHVNYCGGLKSVNPNDFFALFGVALCPNGGCDNPNVAY
jgi:murein DD-endopeptidase MepM/ murein hydrolase activator NlpD